MPTIQIEAQVSDQDILKAVEQLSPQDFQQFVSKVLALRAQRNANSLPTQEAELLQRINLPLPEDLLKRYRPLLAKRQQESLTPDEHAELLQLSEEMEGYEANRVAALAELAALRKIPLPTLMRDLGIAAPNHA